MALARKCTLGDQLSCRRLAPENSGYGLDADSGITGITLSSSREPRRAGWADFDGPKSEQILLPRLRIRADYLQSSSDGLIVVDPQMVQGNHAFVLNGNGGSELRQFEVTAAVRPSHDDVFYFFYVRRHSAGSLNDFNNYLANFPPAVVLPNYYTTLPGDVPNRFLAWGVLHFPWKLQLMPKVEYRSGFAYSSLDTLQQYSGLPNQLRFDPHYSLSR